MDIQLESAPEAPFIVGDTELSDSQLLVDPSRETASIPTESPDTTTSEHLYGILAADIPDSDDSEEGDHVLSHEETVSLLPSAKPHQPANKKNASTKTMPQTQRGIGTNEPGTDRFQSDRQTQSDNLNAVLLSAGDYHPPQHNHPVDHGRADTSPLPYCEPREIVHIETERGAESMGSVKNCPPFPQRCPPPFRPCCYFSIKTEISRSERRTVYILLGLLIYWWILLLINLLLAVAGAITIGTVNNGHLTEALTTMGVSVAYLVLFIPGSLFCLFIPVYQAYRKKSILAFIWFIVMMSFQFLLFFFGVSGIPNFGMCGWFNGAQLFDTSKNTDRTPGQIAVGSIFIIFGFFWFTGYVLSAILLVLVLKDCLLSRGRAHNLRAPAEGVRHTNSDWSQQVNSQLS